MRVTPTPVGGRGTCPVRLCPGCWDASGRGPNPSSPQGGTPARSPGDPGPPVAGAAGGRGAGGGGRVLPRPAAALTEGCFAYVNWGSYRARSVKVIKRGRASERLFLTVSGVQ